MALWSKVWPVCKKWIAACKKAARQIRPTMERLGRLALRHRLATTLSASLLALSMLMSVMTVSIHKIEVLDEGKSVATYHGAFTENEDILERVGLSLADGDELSRTEDGNHITLSIARGFPVHILADGGEKIVMLANGTVADALKKAKITCNKEDILSHDLTEGLKAEMKIRLDRVTIQTVEITEEIEYETKKIKTDDLYVGNKRTVQKGENGSKKCTYSITYINGEETDRELLSEEILQEPVDKIIEVGSKIKSTFQKTASTPTSYKKVMAMECTAYAAGGSTYSGLPAQWGVIAVDPKVIPLGTKVYIETTDGKYIYGTAVAADIGSAIKGNIIDICVNSRAEAYAFGRRTVNVYIL
jgi:uncharacterized protein YabE (DUF348 family)